MVSSGTSVSVTAPAEGGSTAAVPVSAAGHSATLTLVSEGAAPAPAPTPERSAATPVNRADAERIDLEATITGNQMVSTLGLRQAVSLFNQFQNVSRDGLKLRYLDVNGQIIQGVERDVDKISRP